EQPRDRISTALAKLGRRPDPGNRGHDRSAGRGAGAGALQRGGPFSGALAAEYGPMFAGTADRWPRNRVGEETDGALEKRSLPGTIRQRGRAPPGVGGWQAALRCGCDV